MGWFANHYTCPLSNFDCRCQFDGIQKLTRPALAATRASNDDDNDKNDEHQQRAGNAEPVSGSSEVPTDLCAKIDFVR